MKCCAGGTRALTNPQHQPPQKGGYLFSYENNNIKPADFIVVARSSRLAFVMDEPSGRAGAEPAVQRALEG